MSVGATTLQIVLEKHIPITGDSVIVAYLIEYRAHPKSPTLSK